ncbi:MAG TPA: 2-C-methyl-D-erythritol 2,4-cyclodiphosphate synthase [Chitinophagaceae bacterium]|jgi:2-C-methyl-D-erythritol 2,4-cyclodiphosphate synthase|nr:2-C-methyl-D-erythritol 2,4-cyclodiphosphate synthase [Chitinophagaceae bacterium]
MTTIRTGLGVDFHQLEEGKAFMLGGIHIPHHKGATGHSDADVLLHAICDALLGAAGLEDIGTQFPDTDPAYKNIDSKILLQQTVSLIKRKGYHVVNIDSTVCLQEPKIKPYIPEMKTCIAAVTCTTAGDVGIKATTTEQMGFVGREEGVMAYATVLLSK